MNVPLPSQPSGRVWCQDETGNWVNELVDASKEEMAQAEAAVRRRNHQPQNFAGSAEEPHWKDLRNSNHVALPASNISSIHQKYAMRLSGGKPSGNSETGIEEGGYRTQDSFVGEDGVKYHFVKPSDTFQFILLKYKITADQLWEANNFAGKSLAGAPKKLAIPPPKKKPSPIKEDEKKESFSSETAFIGDVKMKSGGESEGGENQVTPSPGSTFTSPVSAFTPPASPVVSQKPTLAATIMSGRKEENVQYHRVEPDDSLRWICLKYKVNANDLRRANSFTGSNLKLAPKKLIIPKPTPRAKKQPSTRFRRLRTDGSGNSARSFKEDASLTSSLLSGVDAFVIDEDSASFLHSSFRKMHDSAQNNEWEGLEGLADMSPLDTSGHNSMDMFQVAPGQMPMVHLPDVHKLTMEGDRESESSTDEEEDPELTQLSENGPRYHDVRSSDTIEYLCMKYRVSAPALRRANIGLTGRNLQTGPKRLIIPPRVILNSSYKTKDTRDTQETETVTTHDDETNTLALSEGHSSYADQEAVMADEDSKPLYHDVQPNDTMQGICQQYGVSAYELRRANNFRGLNLSSAPDRLIIPRNERNRSKDFKETTEEEKVEQLLSHVPISKQTKKPVLTHDEARAYLEFNDWNFNQALRNFKVDSDWSSQKAKAGITRRNFGAK